MSTSTGDFFQMRLFPKETLFTSDLGPETRLIEPGVPIGTGSTYGGDCRQRGKDSGHRAGTSVGEGARKQLIRKQKMSHLRREMAFSMMTL